MFARLFDVSPEPAPSASVTVGAPGDRARTCADEPRARRPLTPELVIGPCSRVPRPPAACSRRRVEVGGPRPEATGVDSSASTPDALQPERVEPGQRLGPDLDCRSTTSRPSRTRSVSPCTTSCWPSWPVSVRDYLLERDELPPVTPLRAVSDEHADRRRERYRRWQLLRPGLESTADPPRRPGRPAPRHSRRDGGEQAGRPRPGKRRQPDRRDHRHPAAAGVAGRRRAPDEDAASGSSSRRSRTLSCRTSPGRRSRSTSPARASSTSTAARW